MCVFITRKCPARSSRPGAWGCRCSGLQPYPCLALWTRRYRGWWWARRCASAGKRPCLEGINPHTGHHSGVSRNPCESLLLILRQWLLWTNISAGVTLKRSDSCCPSCSLALVSLCGLADAVGSGGPERGCMCLPHLAGEGTPGKGSLVSPWRIPSHWAIHSARWRSALLCIDTTASSGVVLMRRRAPPLTSRLAGAMSLRGHHPGSCAWPVGKQAGCSANRPVCVCVCVCVGLAPTTRTRNSEITHGTATATHAPRGCAARIPPLAWRHHDPGPVRGQLGNRPLLLQLPPARGERGQGERSTGEALLRLDRGTPGRIGTGRRVGAAGPSDSTDRSACLSVVPCAVSWRFGITHDVDTHPLFALAQLARHSFRNMDDVMGLSVGSFAEDEA
jgi:hypothetical protein